MHCLSRAFFAAAATFALAAAPVGAADHGDTPLLTSIGRSDAKITDLHAFVNGSNLVLALSTNVNVPTSAATYTFPSDLVLTIHIDTDAAVSFADATANAVYGGKVLAPAEVSSNVRLKVKFKSDGTPVLMAKGVAEVWESQIAFFAGLRDDPFIRGNRAGRNVGSVVIEIPLAAINAPQSTLLVWATSKVDDVFGPFQDLAGRALRSMFPENDYMNTTSPSMHRGMMRVAPDVMILDTSKPATFPNGRALTDDVVDLVGDVRVTSTDSPFPSTNDLPFLNVFPYLANPHPAH